MKEKIENRVDFGDMESSFFLIGLINQFNNEFQTAADALFGELSWKQVFFMNCIILFREPPSIKEMAELIGCSHQNAKQILIKLERAGFVSVSQDQKDKRMQRIALTEKARQFRETYNAASMEAMQKLFADVTADDLETVIRVFQQLTGNLDKFYD